MTAPSGNNFRRTGDAFLQKCINLVAKEHNSNGSNVIDDISKEKDRIDSQKRCLECGCESDIIQNLPKLRW